MKKLSLKIAALVLALSPLAATATPSVVEATCINEATQSCTVGIDGLVIGGMTFNVDFVQGIYETIFEDSDPFFLGDETGALEALVAIVNVLNGTPFANVLGLLGVDGVGSNHIFSPYAQDLVQNEFSAYRVRTQPDPNEVPDHPRNVDDGADYDFTWAQGLDTYAFAVFEKVTGPAVPEPGTLTLLAIGLAGLGISRRKTKTQYRA